MILRILVASVLMHIAFSSMRLTVSLAALAAGATSIEVGVLVSLLALGPTFTSVAFGRYIDRAGVRRPIIAGTTMLAVAASIGIVFPVQPGFLMPLALLALTSGLGFLFVTLVSQKTVGFISAAQNRQANFAWLAMGMSASGLISPVMTGFLIDRIGYAAVFEAALFSTAAGFAVFALSFSKLPTALAPTKDRPKSHAWDLVLVPRLRRVLIVSGLVSMAWDLQHFMLPVYGHAAGLSATEIGWLTGSFFSATFLVRFLMPWTAKHFTEWQFLTLTLAVGGAAYALFPLFSGFVPLLVCAFVLGLGLGSSQPNVMSLLHSQAPDGREGEALGLRTMFTNACHTVLPTAFGLLTSALGAASIFAAMAAILGGAAAASRRSQKKNDTAT